MPIYRVLSYSPVPGDHAFVEADTPDEAFTVLQAALQKDAMEPDHLRPITEWEAHLQARPFCLIEWTD